MNEKMERTWQNVVFDDRVGNLCVEDGKLFFSPLEGGEPLFSVSLISFSFCRFLVKNEAAGQVRLILEAESRNPRTLDIAFSKLSHVQEFTSFRNECVHSR